MIINNPIFCDFGSRYLISYIIMENNFYINPDIHDKIQLSVYYAG